MGEDRRDAGLPGEPSSNSQDLKDESQTVASSYTNSTLPPGHSTPLSGVLPTRTASHQSASQSTDFEFVLVNDNQSRRQVRRHAMRQHMRQRRLDSIARLETSRTPIGGWVIRETTKTSPSCQSQSPEDAQVCSPESSHIGASGENQPVGEKETGFLPRVSTSRIKRKDASTLSNFSNRLPDPRAAPGVGGIRDPFDSYPVVMGHADHELIQHYIVTYPSMMYNLAGSIACSPMTEIFRQFALHHRLAFQAMLAIASKHRANMEGKTESVLSLTHKMRTLRMMNRYIQEETGAHNDETIYAVASMAVIEKWSRDASIEQMHFNGLLSMIRNRGGMRGLRVSSPFLEKILYWVDFSCARKAIVSASLPWTGTVPDNPPGKFDILSSDLQHGIPYSPGTTAVTESLCDYARACEDFLGFFRHLRQLEDVVLDSAQNIAYATTSLRTKRFTSGTLLHSILTVLPDYDHGIRGVRFIDEYTSMACLLFLNVALYDCYLTSSNFDWYLDWLHMEVNRLNPYSNPSVTSVLWILLNNGGHASGEPGDKGERCWLVSRMLRVAKRLEWKRNGTIWDQLRNMLIGFILTQQECALPSDHAGEDALMARQQRSQTKDAIWDENEVRKDILGVEYPGSSG